MLDSNFYTSMSNVLTQWSDFRVSKNLYKAYFNMKKSESTSESESTTKKKEVKYKNSVEDKLGTLSSNMSSSVNGLEAAFATDKDGNIDYDKAFSAANSFVNSYNELVSSIKKSGDQTVSGKQEFIANMTNAYNKRLANVGITVKTDGTLEIDKNTFNSASADDLAKIFGKNESFASFMGSQAKQLSNYAAISKTNTTSYTQSGKKKSDPLTSGELLNMLN
ncbi:MAG: hypothetical protein NC084_09110 [Bacteroides sp.]|nr:hypothetical protein [Eubacterium sp.]MCM1419024.1 hypothetical protein [Roseburia sp.]MCM1462854.1 hypothetical protein [Bacteroides sp.]